MQREVFFVSGRQQGKTHAGEIIKEMARHHDADIVVIGGNVEFRKRYMDETIPEPVKPIDPTLPMRLSLDPNSPDFHPSYMRVGLRIDGKERNDIQFYDVKRLEYMTTALSSHSASSIEPYWRYDENRQQRRARERWEGKRK